MGAWCDAAAERRGGHGRVERFRDDVDVLSTQRVNRAVLPFMRDRGRGLPVWVGFSSTRGGHPPFLGPYVAARAAMNALAESYAAEPIKFGFGIETTLMVHGAGH